MNLALFMKASHMESLQNKERADQSVIEGQTGWWGLW